MGDIVCVVLPTYNEAQNIKILIPRIFGEASKIAAHDLYVLVVDDNSPDGTQEAVRDLMTLHPNLHLLPGKRNGLGEACKRGIRYAIQDLHASLIIQMDADLQHDPSLLPLFVTLSDYGFSLVVGSRFAPGGATTNFPWHRKLISLAGTHLVRVFGGLPPISDCTSGYRCIKADLIANCNLRSLSSRGYSFYSSLLCELVRNGARVIEVPIVFGIRDYGESKLSLRDQIEFFINLFRIRFRGLLNSNSGRDRSPLWETQTASPPSSQPAERRPWAGRK
jgi:dolichol-phosphate mannosyltransferase